MKKLLLAVVVLSLLAVASFSQSTNKSKIRGIGKSSDGVWLTDGGLKVGDPKSPVKIEVYYDLQCPACATFNTVLETIVRKFGDKVFMVFRHFPLQIPAHDKAIMAARVVEAAKRQGKGHRMLAMILDTQKTWTGDANAKKILFAYATHLGLDMSQFASDYDDDATIRSIMDDVIRAKQLDLNAAPTVFLNDEELRFTELPELETKIAALIDQPLIKRP